MPRVGTCKDCGKRFKVPDTTTATRAKCKACGGVVEIPAAGAAAPAAARAPAAKAPAARAPAAPAKAPARAPAKGKAPAAPTKAGGRRAAAGAAKGSRRKGGDGEATAAGGRKGARGAKGGTRAKGGKGRGKGKGDEDKKSPVALIVILAVVILGGGAAAWFFMQGDDAPVTPADDSSTTASDSGATATAGDDAATGAEGAGDDAGAPAEVAPTSAPGESGPSGAASPAEDGAAGGESADDAAPAPAPAPAAKPVAGSYDAPTLAAFQKGTGEALPTKLDFEPLPPVLGTTQEQVDEWQDLLARLYVIDGGETGRRRKNLLAEEQEFDAIDAIPAYIGAINGIDLHDDDAVRGAYGLIKSWQERVGRIPSFSFDGDVTKMDDETMNKRVEAVHNWYAWWTNDRADRRIPGRESGQDAELLDDYREKVAIKLRALGNRDG